VPSLLLRNVDEATILRLKKRARRHGRSVEAEYRAILVAALARPQKRSLAHVLVTMPNVGLDADFARLVSQKARSRRV
jgi:antitoxin FitA